MPIALKRILCPVDFSLPSTHAFHYALAVAEWFHAQVSVVHVHRLRRPVAALVHGGRTEGPPALSATDGERDQLAQNLRAFVSSEAPNWRDVTWHLDESTEIPECIVNRAWAIRADVVVVGTHGRTGALRYFIGSVAERVLRSAPCPVLTVPPHAPVVPGTTPRLDRILCAVDFSDVSRRAVDCAVSVAERAGAKLTVAHIVELPPDIPNAPEIDLTDYRRARFDRAHQQMEHLMAAYAPSTVPCTVLLLAGQAGPELLQLARDQQAGLVVMGVHARRALDLFLFGSVAHHVVRDAPCPVLTVRA